MEFEIMKCQKKLSEVNMESNLEIKSTIESTN